MDFPTLQQTCLDCRRCGLAETRNHVVFGVGPADAEVLFVGEGPGQQVDLKGARGKWTRKKNEKREKYTKK